MSEETAEQDRIESGLEQTRARMDQRLNELQERLTPGQIMDDIVSYIRGSEGGEFAQTLIDRLRANPLPAAVTGIGLAWLMASDFRPTSGNKGGGTALDRADAASRGHTLDDQLRRADESVIRGAHDSDEIHHERLATARGKVLGVNRSPGDTTESFGEQVQDALSAARQSAATSAQAVREGASDALGHLSSAAHDARDQLAQTRQVAQQKVGEAFSTVTDNPVMLGALSLAVGAFLGALIPQSRQEQSALGDLAKRTREAASDLAQGAVDRGGAAVKQALDAGRDTAQAQGLSGNTPVKDIVQGITDGELRRDLTQVATDALHAGARALHADPGAASTSSTAPVGTAAQD